MYIEIKTQLIVDDEEIIEGSRIRVTAKSGEVIIGELQNVNSDDIDIDIESKMFGDVSIEIDKIESIEEFRGE